ncbi:unnamed protein product [Aphanomyces euteiches]
MAGVPTLGGPADECGRLAVPLDHLDPSNPATIEIALQRYRTTLPSKGTILVNPGGPGSSGLSLARPEFLVLTGGEYDILGFDPRGVGASQAALCTQTVYTGIQDARSLKAKPVPFEEPGGETSIDRYAVDYALQVKRCERFDGKLLKYLSTSYVARDMDAIRAALGEQVLHYYGISYGTFLGLTYVNMFPDRVGRIVIDSALDPQLYLGPTPALMSKSATAQDAVFEGFCKACEAAGAQFCPLATESLSVSQRLRSFFKQVAAMPLILSAGDDWTSISSQEIRQQVFDSMEAPSRWPQLADLLQSYLNGTATSPARPASCQAEATTLYSGEDVEWGIYVANDGDNSATTAQDWEDHLKLIQMISPLFGGAWFVQALFAKFWTIRPVERYVGPWNNTLRSRILILNNEKDPETQLEGAQAVAAALG